MTREMRRRIIDRIDRSSPDGCWPWTGARDKDGYGTVSFTSSNKQLAHRVIWMLFKGAIPEGLCVLHKCDNPSCCKIAHLFLGTQHDNTIDKCKKGRHPLSERRLIANEIRQRYVKRGDGPVLCKEYGISKSALSRIVLNQMWKDLS